jgi:predicted MFS family arabinose efflux permease
MIFYPSMSAVGTWFKKNRALAYGIMVSGSSLGGVIFPIMIQRLVPQTSFGWSMRAAAFLILGLLIYANLTIRSRLPPNPTPWSLREFISPLGELPFFLIVLASFLFFFGVFLPFNYIILYAEANGMSSRLASYMLAVLNAVSIFGRTLPGWIADRVGRFNTMIVMCFLSCILVLGLWLPSRGNVPIILFAAFYGFSSGAFVSLAPACVAQISDIRKIGVRTGTMFATISVAALVGNPIGGALITAERGGYTHLQIFGGVMMFAGGAVYVGARASLVGWKIRVKV